MNATGAMSLTEEQREQHVCCVKPRLCKEDHYHERDVVRLIDAERERIAAVIDDTALTAAVLQRAAQIVRDA